MAISIGKTRFVWSDNAKMLQFAFTGCKAITDLPERVRFSEMAKKHTDELLPAAKTFRPVFSTMPSNQRLEFRSGKKIKHLAEHTHIFTHAQVSLLKVYGFGHLKYTRTMNLRFWFMIFYLGQG